MSTETQIIVTSSVLSAIALLSSLLLLKYRKCVIIKNLLPKFIIFFNVVSIIVYILIILIEGVVEDVGMKKRLENEISNFIFLFFVPFQTYILLYYCATIRIRTADLSEVAQYMKRAKSYNFMGPLRLSHLKTVECITTGYKSNKQFALFCKSERNIFFMLCLNFIVYFVTNIISTFFPDLKTKYELLSWILFLGNLLFYYCPALYTLGVFYKRTVECFINIFFLSNFFSLFFALTIIKDFGFVLLYLTFFLIVNTLLPLVYFKFQFGNQIIYMEERLTSVNLLTDKYLYISLMQNSNYYLGSDEIKLWKLVQLYKEAPVRDEADALRLSIYYKYLDPVSRNSIIVDAEIRNEIFKNLKERDIYRTIFDVLLKYVYKNVISYMFINVKSNEMK